jgi:hypothetical protein
LDANCDLLHPKMSMPSPRTPLAPPIATPFPPIPWSRRPDCMYYVKGSCSKGDKCVFRHNENAKFGTHETCPSWLSTGTCVDQGCFNMHPKLPKDSQGTSQQPPPSPTSVAPQSSPASLFSSFSPAASPKVALPMLTITAPSAPKETGPVYLCPSPKRIKPPALLIPPAAGQQQQQQ